MISQEEARQRVIRRLRNTNRNETVCLWGWETEVLLMYIDELKRGRKNGTSEIQTDDSKGSNAGVGD